MNVVGLLLLVVVALTSALAFALGGRAGLSRLHAALVTLVEIVGATTLFRIANVLVGGALGLATRRLTSYYPPMYDVSDIVLLVLSLLQAVTFESCRRARIGPRGSPSR